MLISLNILTVSAQPTTPEQHKVMLNRIKNGEYNFEGAEKWKKISDNAKDLIQKMLVVDTNERYTIKQILQHPWLQEVEVHFLFYFFSCFYKRLFNFSILSSSY